ncbi:hypothetical protein [Streptomyces hokutonensis]|uniref:hypothetical protein n=1 Tax=Streptomyces hokutonensis TaxID=1306990 RepID=UPI00380EA8F9
MAEQMLPYPSAVIPHGVRREGAPRLVHVWPHTELLRRYGAPRVRNYGVVFGDPPEPLPRVLPGGDTVYRYQYLTPRWCEHVPRAWAL